MYLMCPNAIPDCRHIRTAVPSTVG